MSSIFFCLHEMICIKYVLPPVRCSEFKFCKSFTTMHIYLKSLIYLI